MADRLKRWLVKAWSVWRQDRAYRTAQALLLLFGVVLRLIGYITAPSGLWLDEANWAKKLLNRPIAEFRFRPLGFMWTEKQLVGLFEPNEFWLRFLSCVPSLFVLLLVPYIASRLLKSRFARLLVLFLFAAQPALIDLAKEFKPYSIEVFVHLAPLALYLRYRQTGRRLYFGIFLASLPLAFLFAYNIVFAWPGLLLLALYHAYNSWKWRGAALVVSTGAVCLALLGVIYFAFLRGITTDRTETYWANKYDVFYHQTLPRAKQRQNAAIAEQRAELNDEAAEAEDDEPAPTLLEQPGRVMWTIEKYDDIAALPGLRRQLWKVPSALPASFGTQLGAVDRYFWVGLHFFALGMLAFRRRFEDLLLLFLPLFCVVLLNAIGEWPIGAFRTNLYLCSYSLLIAGVGVDLLATSAGRIYALASVIAFVTVLPGFAFGFDWRLRKRIWTRHQYAREILAELRSQRQAQLRKNPKAKPTPLFLDAQTFEPQNFYLDVVPDTKEEYRRFFKKHFKQENWSGFQRRLERDLKKKLEASSQPVWIVISKRRTMDTAKKYINRNATILMEKYIGDDNDHLLLLVDDHAEPHDQR